MPKRRDFDNEYDMELDRVLEDMEFFSDDNDDDIDFKQKMLIYYNQKLDERIERKNFVIDRGLLDLKRLQQKSQEKRKNKEERDIMNGMKVFARYSTHDDHERIVNSLIKERNIRELISQLRQFQKNGLTSFD